MFGRIEKTSNCEAHNAKFVSSGIEVNSLASKDRYLMRGVSLGGVVRMIFGKFLKFVSCQIQVIRLIYTIPWDCAFQMQIVYDCQ